jgi:hypothetical protein
MRIAGIITSANAKKSTDAKSTPCTTLAGIT